MELLNERKKTHGEFCDVSEVTMKLWNCVDLKDTPEEIQLAIAMILHKIARINCGNYEFEDHWDDIIGYTTLAKKKIFKDKVVY